MDKEPEFPRLAKLGKGYRSLAVLILNTAIFFVVLNLLAYPVVLILNRSEVAGALSYGMDTLRQVYPGMSDDQIRQLLEETWSRQYIYEPFTQFKEGLLEGEYINTDPAGFRKNDEQAPWPVDNEALNIFVFGGSTTFGYGVADGDTIPSHLQAAMQSMSNCQQPVNVYNFGRANYYSTQERLLFEELLAKGFRPDIAVFNDGINEFFHLQDEPKFTGQLSYLMTESDTQLVWRAAKTLPLLDLISEVRSRAGGSGDSAPTATPKEKLQSVIDRYLMNKRLIENLANEFDVQTYFIWQPVPTYKYDIERDIFYDAGQNSFSDHLVSGEGYPLMAEEIESGRISLDESTFLWLGDLQQDRTDPLYVDRVHYNGQFSQTIAEAIADFISNSCS